MTQGRPGVIGTQERSSTGHGIIPGGFYIGLRPGAHRSQGGLAIMFHFCVKKHTERSYVPSLSAFVRQTQPGLSSALAGIGFVPLGR